MTKPAKHHVDFMAVKKVKEPTVVDFRTKDGKRVDFVAEKPVKETVEVSFMAKGKKR